MGLIESPDNRESVPHRNAIEGLGFVSRSELSERWIFLGLRSTNHKRGEASDFEIYTTG